MKTLAGKILFLLVNLFIILLINCENVTDPVELGIVRIGLIFSDNNHNYNTIPVKKDSLNTTSINNNFSLKTILNKILSQDNIDEARIIFYNIDITAEELNSTYQTKLKELQDLYSNFNGDHKNFTDFWIEKDRKELELLTGGNFDVEMQRELEITGNKVSGEFELVKGMKRCRIGLFDNGELIYTGISLDDELPFFKVSVYETNYISLYLHKVYNNTPPQAVFTIFPDTGTVSTTFLFDASDSRDEHDEINDLRFRWDFENDGNWDTDFQANFQIEHIYQEIGNYTVKMEVRDQRNAADTASNTLTVIKPNTKPVASFTIIPDTGTVNTEFTFDATSSYENEDETADLEVRWDFENDGVWDTDFGYHKKTNHQYSAPGIYTVQMEILDKGGSRDTTTNSVVVIESNNPPTAEFSVTPDSGNIDTEFTFDASNSYDLEDQTADLKVRWDFEDDGNWDTDYRFNKIITHQYSQAGQYKIKLQVVDSKGLTATATENVQVLESNTPPIADFFVSPDTGNINTKFKFDASNSHDEEDISEDLKVRWDFEDDGHWDTDFRYEKIIYHQYSEPGLCNIRLEVIDSENAASTTTKVVRVFANNTPPVAEFNVIPDTGTIETEFVFDASESYDTENLTSDLRVRWDFEDDGHWDTDFRYEKQVVHRYTNPGEYDVTLEVVDPEGLTSKITQHVTVLEQIPGDLIVHYPFTGNADDWSDYNNHGFVNEARLTYDRFGEPNKAYYFDGENDYISCPNNESLNPSAALTISLWIKTDAPNGNILNKEGTNSGYGIDLLDYGISFIINQNTLCNFYKPQDDSGWFHIAASWNPDTAKLYINGNLVDHNTDMNFNQINASQNDLTIGRLANLSSQYVFNGIIDDIRIYKKVLSENHIRDLYHKNNW